MISVWLKNKDISLCSKDCKNTDRITVCTHMHPETNSADLTCLQFSGVLTHAKGGNLNLKEKTVVDFWMFTVALRFLLCFACDSEHMVVGTLGSAQESFLLKCQEQSQHINGWSHGWGGTAWANQKLSNSSYIWYLTGSMGRWLVRGEWRDEKGREGLTDHQQSEDKHIRYLIPGPSFNMSSKINHLPQ